MHDDDDEAPPEGWRADGRRIEATGTLRVYDFGVGIHPDGWPPGSYCTELQDFYRQFEELFDDLPALDGMRVRLVIEPAEGVAYPAGG